MHVFTRSISSYIRFNDATEDMNSLVIHHGQETNVHDGLYVQFLAREVSGTHCNRSMSVNKALQSGTDPIVVHATQPS